MSGVQIQVQGLEDLKKRFKGIPQTVETRLDADLSSLALEYEERAAQAAPVNLGMLKGGITSGKVGPLQFDVVSKESYSAYVEFGTRSKVQVPGELVEYAAQFKGGKSGVDPKKAIFEWCKDKGIPKEAWYPIFIKLMTVGANPHPFFFIHLPWARAEVQKKAEAVVKGL